MDLFSEGPERLPIPDGVLLLHRAITLPLARERLFARLLEETPWRAETIMLFGQPRLQPRLCAWFGDAAYTYSGLQLQPRPWTPLLQDVRACVEQLSGARFNSVLLNLYRDGQDSMGMHSDDEPELGRDPVIASLSLGATRRFILRHKDTAQRLQIDLADGDLLVMAGTTQHYWQHGINKSRRVTGPRINLTFRHIR